jgi:peptidoglycan/xylan/chitin deacetylase (PgdA/CDA1 family)
MNSFFLLAARILGILLLFLCSGSEGAAPLYSGNRMMKTIAITFDDGPHETLTPKLLETLQEVDVKASFFLVGKMAERYPALVREIFARGHTIGNHSQTHRNSLHLSHEEFLADILRCNEVLEQQIPVRIRFFRPPGGNYNKQILSLVRQAGLQTILWDINSRDYTGVSAASMTKRIVSKAEPGSILLFHTGVTSTIIALPEIVRLLRLKGYEFVTLDQLVSKHSAFNRVTF